MFYNLTLNISFDLFAELIIRMLLLKPGITNVEPMFFDNVRMNMNRLDWTLFGKGKFLVTNRKR